MSSIPRKSALPRSPPTGYTTPLQTCSSVYDADSVRLDTPSTTIKRRRPNFESLHTDGDLLGAVAELTVLVKTLVSDNYYLKKELVDIKEQLNSLVVSKNNPSPNKPSLSYASVVSSSNNNKILIINPSAVNTQPQESRNIIKSKLKPSNYNLCGVSSTKKGGVIVQCPSSAERERLKTDAVSRLGDEFIITAPGKILPRVRIFGFSDMFNAVDLVRVLKEQNHDLFADASHLSVEHIFQAKKNKRFGAKLEVDPSTLRN